MSRNRHKMKVFEAELKSAERQGWTITGGGNTYFKLKCPNPCLCMKMMPLTPSNPNKHREWKNQVLRVTCWKEED